MTEEQMLLEMAAIFEEYKLFPKDKVERQVEKAKAAYRPDRARKMTAVKNYKTRSTDFNKADQKFTGKDYDKTRDRTQDHYEIAGKQYGKADKAIKKMTKKEKKSYFAGDDPTSKQTKKADKADRAGNRAYSRGSTIDKVRQSSVRARRSDDAKQAEHNKKMKSDRAKAKKMLKDTPKMPSKSDIGKVKAAFNKPAVKGATKGGFKKETLNFTDFINDTVSPLYEVKGEIPKCPPGYRFDKNQMMCVPKTKKDAVGDSEKYGNKDMRPGNGETYNTFGNSGYDGAGYAWEEKPTTNDLSGSGGY